MEFGSSTERAFRSSRKVPIAAAPPLIVVNPRPGWLRYARYALYLAIPCVSAVLLVYLFLHYLRPQPMDWTAIYRGIDMRCDEGVGARANSRMMALRVHLDEPTLELFMRPIDPQALPAGGQYLLGIADLERASHALSVLMNTTLYYPHPILRSYPGKAVRAVDTVVSHGKATHYHPHSYLLWIDGDRVPHVEMEKPPPHESIDAAEWGVGLQGVQVRDGVARPNATSDHERVQRRTFIGVDPDARLLYLIAWEAANAYEMMDGAIAVGVKHGGQLDSGHATHLLVGSDAKGIHPLTGIRGGRPLGPYMGIRAKALD